MMYTIFRGHDPRLLVGSGKPQGIVQRKVLGNESNDERNDSDGGALRQNHCEMIFTDVSVRQNHCVALI